MLAEREAEVDTTSGGVRFEQSEAAASVEQELRTMALAVS